MTYVLLTRAPLYSGRSLFSLDLHVLSAPLTFVLSQDQTLQFESFGWRLTSCRSSKLPVGHSPPCFLTLSILPVGYRQVLGTRAISRGIRTQFSRTEGVQLRDGARTLELIQEPVNKKLSRPTWIEPPQDEQPWRPRLLGR